MRYRRTYVLNNTIEINFLFINCISLIFILFKRCVDLRTVAFDVPPQEILTKDSVTVSVDAVVFFQVKSWFKIQQILTGGSGSSGNYLKMCYIKNCQSMIFINNSSHNKIS